MIDVIIGIDPGKSGGVAVLFADGKMEAYKMPETERDINDIFEEVAHLGNCVAYLEKVHSMPGQGVSSTFTFGKGYGFLRGCLVANKIRFVDVTPQSWQKALGVTKSDSKKEHKNKLKGMAQQLRPELKINLATADAILIAEYAKKQEG